MSFDARKIVEQLPAAEQLVRDYIAARDEQTAADVSVHLERHEVVPFVQALLEVLYVAVDALRSESTSSTDQLDPVFQVTQRILREAATAQDVDDLFSNLGES